MNTNELRAIADFLGDRGFYFSKTEHDQCDWEALRDYCTTCRIVRGAPGKRNHWLTDLYLKIAFKQDAIFMISDPMDCLLSTITDTPRETIITICMFLADNPDSEDAFFGKWIDCIEA